MRLLVSGILVWLILSTALRDILVLAAFHLNQDYIVSNLCVDRDLRENMCHGSCQLKVELEKNHDNQQSSGFTLLSDQLPITFFFHANQFKQDLMVMIETIIPKNWQGVHLSNFLFRLLRPPQV